MSSALTMASGATQKDSAAAYDILQRHGKSFHFASLVLDRATATRCARLYAFCRHLDDLADEEGDPCIARQQLRAVTEMLKAGQSSDPVVSDFLLLAADSGIPVEPAIELTEGVLSDLGEVRIRDLAELHTYCYRVAGTVGRMMCGVLGVRDPQAYPFAIDLGIAMQMTNIARDVHEDALAGRRYLPATLVGDVEPTDLLDPDSDLQNCLARAVKSLLQEAEEFYKSGNAGLVYVPTKSRLGIRIAARVYRQIGVRLRRRKFAVWEGRTVVPFWEKILVSLTALRMQVARSPRHSRPVHKQTLHRFLREEVAVPQQIRADQV